MTVLHSQILEGLISGFRTRRSGFLALLAIALGMVPAMVWATAAVLKKTLSLDFIASLGPTLWVSVAFSAYLAVIACLQQYHRSREDSQAFSALAGQVNVVVSAMLFALLVTTI